MMNQLKIRTKMMLWYTLLTSVLLIIFIPILYSSISNSLYSDAKSLLRSTVSSAQSGIEYENGTVSWDENTVISGNMPTFVTNRNNQILYQNSNLQELMDVPFVPGVIRTLEYSGKKWMVLDETVSKENTIVADVRAFIPLKSLEHTLYKIKIIIIISIPLYLLITVFGGLFIAKKALQPINTITQTAKIIGRGDLASRITQVENHDEVGELSETFNEMLEKLEESFNKQKRFASDASHELRTPVAIIMAYSEALLSDSDLLQNKSVLEKSLHTIYQESERMNSIIAQLLMLTRGYEGRYQLVKEQIDICEVIDNVINQLEETAKEAKINISFITSEPILIKADQSLITHMMLNLVENAIKYGREGGHVWVRTEIQEEEVIVTIEDDGIGIEPEHLKHIFERFYRADQSRDRRGTGLGLSIVKWIVSEHEGRIEVNSQIEKGTTFIIRLKRT
ncbi:MAG TPA: HAMP domain-containing sensor histidine kinase [Mobilitalea sp.]|nr:HAMP domain-containing sensor histidine kinase [Mobilitalea sp.]